MKDFYLVGEDPVTQYVIKRLVKDYTNNLRFSGILPARGSQVKNKDKLNAFNNLAKSCPVVVLLDLDSENCPPEFKSKLTKDMTVSEDFVINIACDEAEAWLMADVLNFSKYFHIPIVNIPQSSLTRLNGPRPRIEVCSPCKSSMHITHNIAQYSTNATIRDCLYVDDPKEKCKSAEYNKVVLPFIEKDWNPEVARKNSYSLDRMIMRLEKLNERS